MFNVLLQVLDDGRLTDGQGRTVDFKNTVIVMTSNVGSQFITGLCRAARRGSRTTQMKKQVTDTLRQVFRPEFLNRIDEIIVFHALTRGQTFAHIVELLLADLAQPAGGPRPDPRGDTGRAPADRRVKVSIPRTARGRCARSIQRLVENPLARALLEGQFKPGTTIKVDADPVSGTLIFSDGGETVVTTADQERRDMRSRREPEQPAGVAGDGNARVN